MGDGITEEDDELATPTSSLVQPYGTVLPSWMMEGHRKGGGVGCDTKEVASTGYVAALIVARRDSTPDDGPTATVGGRLRRRWAEASG